MYKKHLIAFGISLVLTAGIYFVYKSNEQPINKALTFGAFDDPFISLQLATDPDNGECLTTDGTDNVWSSSCGSSGSGVGTVSTSSVPTIGQLAYWTNAGYPSLLSSVATTTASCSGAASCSAFTIIGSAPITISASGGGTGGGTWATTTITGSANYFNYSLNATDVIGIGSTAGTSTSKFWFDPNLSRSFLSYASTTGLTATNAWFGNATTTDVHTVGELCFTAGECMTSPTTVGSNITFYHWNLASEIATYEQLNIQPEIGGTPTDESCAADAGVDGGYCDIDPYVSTTTEIALDDIPSGTWTFHYYTYVNSLVDNSKLEATVFKRTSGGTETYLFQATSSDISSTDIVERQFSVTNAGYDLDPTDRIVVKVRAWTDSVVAKTIHFLYGGASTNYSHIETPINFGNFNFARKDLNETITGAWTFSGKPTWSYSSSTVYSSFLTASTTNLNIGGDSLYDLEGSGLVVSGNVLGFDCSDVEGTGIDCAGEAITLNATGDWTGTIDGNNFAGGAIGTGELIYGGSAGSFSELAVGTNGYVLAMVGGLPVWTATTSMPVLGDVTGTLSATVVGNDSHDHTATTISGLGTADISGLDISDDTNLAVTFPITLTDDTLSWTGLSTSSAAVVGNIPYFSGVNTFANVATGTVSSSGGITTTAGRSVLGGALAISCDVASGSIPGCLSAANWTTFNNKLGSYDAWTHASPGYSATTSALSFPYSSSTVYSSFVTASSTEGLFGTASSSVANILSGINLFGGGVKTTANALCIQLTGSADLCDGSDASGVGGTGVGTVSTSTAPTIGQLAYWSSTGAWPETLASIATGTITCTGSASCVTTGLSVIGGNLTISATGGGSDPFTHPSAGVSATTSLMQLFGQASSTLFSANQAWFGASATTSIASNGLISFPYSSSTDFSSFLTASTTNLNIGGDSLYELCGTGLTCTGNVLALNATGDWTGTIDGNNFAGGAIGVGELIYGGSAGSFSELAVGTNGTVLAMVGGLPTWTATTSMPILGDVTGTLSATVVGNDSHDHTATTISGLGVADFTSANISQWTNDSNFAAFPFTVQTGYNSTSTVIGFNAGLFSNSTTTINGNLFTPGLSQGYLYAGTGGINKTVSTTTLAGQVFPFTSAPLYNSTSTIMGLLNGFFSIASSTISGDFFTPNLTQGFQYVGTNGINKTVSTSTLAGQVFPFTSAPAYNSTSTIIGFLAGMFSNATSTFNGTVDAGGATSFEIPNFDGCTIDAIGETCLDPTANQKGQFLIATSTNASYPAVFPVEQKIWGRTVASTSVDFISGGRQPLPPLNDGWTITKFTCAVDGGTSVVLNVDTLAGGANTTTVTCATTKTIQVVSANNTLASSTLYALEWGTVTGTVDYVTWTAWGIPTRE